MAIEKVAVVGAGAVGAAIGSMIEDGIPDAVTVIADGARAERYRLQGFRINGQQVQFRVRTPEAAERADLVIVATKSYDLDRALTLARKTVGEGTIIMSLLNGITSEEIIAGQFGADRVVPAMILGIDSVRENGEISFTNRGVIHFGPNPELNSASSATEHPQHSSIGAIRELFDRCAISYTVSDDIARTLWWKFMINVGINQPSAILRAPYGVFQRNPEARELMNSAMEEVVAVSHAAGIGLTADDIEGWDKTLTTLSPVGKTSMLQDVEAGRRTEVDLFGGAVVKLGERYGVPVPVNQAMYRMLKTIESEAAGATRA